jgi:hypothetical protein
MTITSATEKDHGYEPSALRDNSTYALMSLDFPKRSARKILERIISPPLGGRDKLHPNLLGFVFSESH